MLTTYGKVKIAGPNDLVILARGTSPTTVARMQKFKTAGGWDTTLTPGLEPRAPSEEEARVQAGGASMKKIVKLPEYTTDISIAKRFAKLGGAVVYIAIRRKFLTAGSVAEAGWVVYGEAPIEKMKWESVEKTVTLIGRGGKFLDAG